MAVFCAAHTEPINYNVWPKCNNFSVNIAVPALTGRL
jgi:hypothetical protein